jgi:hypothetical protein
VQAGSHNKRLCTRGLVEQFFDTTLTGSQRGSVASTSNDDLEIEVLAQER